MLKHRRVLAAVSMAGVLVVGAAACGNDTDSEAEATTTAAAETTTTGVPSDTSARSDDTTTTAVSGEIDDISGTGYYAGFSFELTDAEIDDEGGVDAELTITADVDNLEKTGSRVFQPRVALEDEAGTGVAGSAKSDRVPAGSSGTVTFAFSSDDGFDDLEGWTLLVGESSEARVELPLDGNDQVGRAPVELELSEAELSVDGVDVEFDSLVAQWRNDAYRQVGSDEIAFELTASATNNTDGQTCVRRALSFISPDDEMTAAKGSGDCEPVGETSKGLVFVAVVAEPEAGEWTVEVAGSWGPDRADVSGEVTFELTDEVLTGEMNEASGDDADDNDSDEAGSRANSSDDDDDADSRSTSSTTTRATTSSGSRDSDDGRSSTTRG